jgi:hypothetical protein
MTAQNDSLFEYAPTHDSIYGFEPTHDTILVAPPDSGVLLWNELREQYPGTVDTGRTYCTFHLVSQKQERVDTPPYFWIALPVLLILGMGVLIWIAKTWKDISG